MLMSSKVRYIISIWKMYLDAQKDKRSGINNNWKNIYIINMLNVCIQGMLWAYSLVAAISPPPTTDLGMEATTVPYHVSTVSLVIHNAIKLEVCSIRNKLV